MPPCDMQDYVIVFRVPVMTVALPVAGFEMDLDVACYPLTVDDKDSILKITAGDIAASARVNHSKLPTAVSTQFS